MVEASNNNSQEDGIKTIVTETTNEKGQTVRIIKKIKMVQVLTPSQKERRKLAKFGDSKHQPPGPDSDSTSFGEIVRLKMGIISDRDTQNDGDDQESSGIQLKKGGGSKIKCRICSGEHWTSKCPFKDSKMAAGLETGSAGDDASSAAKGSTGKYVPPSMRAGAKSGSGEQMSSDRRDDFFTLRVTNLSEDVQEGDLRDLTSKFGPTSRVFVARYPGTSTCKGFAFVSFYSKTDAESALSALNGYGYDNLILRVEWAKQNTNK